MCPTAPLDTSNIDLGWEATPDGTPWTVPEMPPPDRSPTPEDAVAQGVDTLLRLAPGRRLKDETMSRSGIKG